MRPRWESAMLEGGATERRRRDWESRAMRGSGFRQKYARECGRLARRERAGERRRRRQTRNPPQMRGNQMHLLPLQTLEREAEGANRGLPDSTSSPTAVTRMNTSRASASRLGRPNSQLARTGRATLAIAIATLTATIGACTKAPQGDVHFQVDGPEERAAELPSSREEDTSGAAPPTATAATAREPHAKPQTTPRFEPQALSEACSTQNATQLIVEEEHHGVPRNVDAAGTQGHEYAPVDAIQTLYTLLAGHARPGTFQVEAAEIRSNGPRISITGREGPVDIGFWENQIEIGRRPFTDLKTISLFHALERVLVGLEPACRHEGVRGSRLRTRAYKDFVRIEFGYGAVVVRLEAASNGPSNPERLYALHALGSEKSLLWGEPPPAPPE